MLSSVVSFAFFQTRISPELLQIFANGKWCFYSFMEFYVINLEKLMGKILIIVSLVRKFYIPYCYNINNTDKRYLFSLFLD